jgi:hypothetical protein
VRHRKSHFLESSAKCNPVKDRRKSAHRSTTHQFVRGARIVEGSRKRRLFLYVACPSYIKSRKAKADKMFGCDAGSQNEIAKNIGFEFLSITTNFHHGEDESRH